MNTIYNNIRPMKSLLNRSKIVDYITFSGRVDQLNMRFQLITALQHLALHIR